MTEIQAGTLARALHNAMLFAGTDETLPILNAVQIVTDGERLTCIGTDRFTLLRQQIPCDHPPTSTVIGRRDIAALLGVLADGHRRQWVREFDDWADEYGDDGEWYDDPFDVTTAASVLIDTEGTLTITVSGRTLTVPPVEGDYPKVEKLLRDPGDPITIGCPPNLILSPALVGRIGKVKGPASMWRVWQNETEKQIFAAPTHISRDTEMLALVMPGKDKK